MGPENFAPIRPTVQKLRHFFEVTDARTHRHFLITSVPLQKFILFFTCEGEGGKHYEPYEISTSSLREG